MKSIRIHLDHPVQALSILRASVRPLQGLMVWISFAIGGVGTLGAETIIATQTYTTPGPYSYTVPANASHIIVKVWGGGGESQGPEGAISDGGSGGFVTAAYSAAPGQVISLVVGSGGAANASAVWRSAGLQVVAGGGGQGGDEHDGESGGSGGAAISVASGPDGSGPTGGGGPMNLSSGIPYSANGGVPSGNGGRGGSGYYGSAAGESRGDGAGSGGGGGSNFFDTGNGYIAGSGQSLGGSGSSPPGTGDPHYPGNNVGAGGQWYSSTGNGAVVILACVFSAPPTITVQPQSQMVDAGGGSTTLTVTATGTPTPTYQWKKNGTAINGATGSNLTVNEVASYVVIVSNSDGSVTSSTATVTVNPAPTAPSSLNYVERTATTVTLTWRAAIDDEGVTGYLVYRGGQLIGSTSDLVFMNSGLTANTTYAYTVKATDAANHLSAASSSLNVTTTQDFSTDTDHDGIPDATETALGTNASAAAGADSSNQTQQNIHRPTR